jgi:hypothetical protein
MANRRFGLYRSYVTINLPASSACNDSAENWVDAKAASCFKVQKSSRTARSRQHGLSFPDRGQVIFLGCAARAALKVTLEKGPMDGWIIGSNDSSAPSVLSDPRQQVSQAVSRQNHSSVSNPARIKQRIPQEAREPVRLSCKKTLWITTMNRSKQRPVWA